MHLQALRRSPLFLTSLVAMSAVGGVGTHIFLPALPAVQQDFAADTGVVQLTISLAMIALGVAPLIYGPLSDMYGRRPMVLAGTIIFLVGCLVCAFSASLWQLVLGRMMQAAGAAAGYSLSRSIARDVYGQEDTARVLAYLMMAVVIAPMLAPSVGGVLTDVFNWRMIFHFTGVVVFLVLLLFLVGLPETNAVRTGGGFHSMSKGMRLIVRVPFFWGYALQSALAMSVFYAFLAAAPYLMTDVLERPARDYGFWFIGLSCCFIFGNFASARLVGRFGKVRLILFGVAATVILLTGGAILFLTFTLTPFVLFLPTTAIAFVQGLILANSQAGAIEAHPEAIGAAAGLSSFLQLAVAALATQVVGLYANGTVWPMVAVMAGTTVMALLIMPLLRREISSPATDQQRTREHG